MKIDNQIHATVRNITENYFLNFYFLNVDISLFMHDLKRKLYICIENIAVKGTVSQNFEIGPGSLFIKSRKKYF